MKTCPKCGSPISDTAKFCPVCGSACAMPTPPVTPDPQPQQQAQPQQPQPQQQAQSQQTAQGQQQAQSQQTAQGQQQTQSQQQNRQEYHQQYQQAQQQAQYQQASYDPYDHTSEFDAKDISDNKVIAMLCYLMGPAGIVIALLGSNRSDYAAFHVRQALKFTVVDILLVIIGLLLCWTVIVPIACGVFASVLWVVRIICFFSICKGKAKEPAIIRSFGFLR